MLLSLHSKWRSVENNQSLTCTRVSNIAQKQLYWTHDSV